MRGLVFLLILASCSNAVPGDHYDDHEKHHDEEVYAMHLQAFYQEKENELNTHYLLKDLIFIPPEVIQVGKQKPDHVYVYSNSFLLVGKKAHCYYETHKKYRKMHQYLVYCAGMNANGVELSQGTKIQMLNSGTHDADVNWCWRYKNGVMTPDIENGAYRPDEK